MTRPATAYRRDDDGTLRYRGAWATDDGVVLHTGKVGQTGTRKLRRTRAGAGGGTAEEALAAFAAESAELGYAPIPDDERGWVVLQYWAFTPDLSHPEDARVMTDLWDALDAHLSARGLGECDGNDVGGAPPNPDYADSTIVNWFCPVVEPTWG